MRCLSPTLLALLLIPIDLSASSYKDEFAHFNPLESDQHRSHDDGTVNHKQGASLFHDFAFTSSTDEAKLRLALLVDDKMDRDKDGLIQLSELVDWLKECQDKYAQKDANRHWFSYRDQLDGYGTLGWKQYAEKEYDHLFTITKHSASREQVDEIKKSHEYHLQRDLRRWKVADLNEDGRLSRNEFKMFLYPENYEHMHSIVVDEKLESLDRDKDGRVSAGEFLSSLKPNEAQPNLSGQESWLREERSKFYTLLDENHDTYLDRTELASWVTKSELNDHSISEAQQLMQVADSNHDHRLSKEEVLAAYHEFVNSHATDFGELLRVRIDSPRDEL